MFGQPNGVTRGGHIDLKTLEETPPWDWPEGTNKFIMDILRNKQAEETDCLLAVELTGDITVINDELVDILLLILQNDNESEKLRSKETDKPLLPAAIKAVANIRPQEAGVVLIEMTDSDDEDIVEAAYETMAMAEVLSGEPFD